MTAAKHFYEMFQPEHYDIYIDINRATKQINGTSTITGNASDKTIYVHQKGMTINSVTADGTAVSFAPDNSVEGVKIDLAKTGKTTLVIDYSAPLTDTMMGIYPSYYELDGVRKELIGTQFETTSARQAFPCVDEPEAKATFNLAIKYDEHEGETIISNMPEIKEEDGVHYFDRTLRMSTYLIAFAFGDMQSKETTTKSGVKVAVFSTKAHNANELDFPLEVAKKGIEFYEDFYDTKYPLPHSWQLALPDFSAGAMENWGLITYRESYLLFDPDNASMQTKQHVATTITHELAHQWFGDLVTLKWWDDLWLNESFANMMEYVAVDAIKPEWNVWETFQTLEVPMALQRDAIDGVQPVHVAVEDPAEIDSIFDSAIVYAKGARMLVMVRALIGDDALRKGLKAYFTVHQYHNAKGDDLWNALRDASGLDIGGIMHSWLQQPGYPVVNVQLKNGHLVLSQKQFFVGDGKDEGRQWQIPLNANYADMPTLMKDKELDLGDYDELRQKNGKPFRLNVGNNSHFIVNYDEKLMKDILASADSLDAISRLQLLQDFRLLAEGRQMSFAQALPMLKSFANDQSSIVNSGLYRLADDLKLFVDADSDAEKNLQKLFGSLSADQVARLGWNAKPGESNDDEVTRPYVLKAALYAQDADAIKQAHALFDSHTDSLSSLPAPIRPLVLTNEIKNFSSQQLFDKLITEYQKSSDASFKADLGYALSRTPDKDFVAELITDFEKPEIIKPQDLRAWFPNVLGNDAGEQAAWDWLRNDWAWIEKTLGGDMEFTGYIKSAASVFKTPERLAEFKAFFDPKLNTTGLTREITMDTRIISGRIELIQADKANVVKAVNAAV